MISPSFCVKALCLTLLLGQASARCKSLPDGQEIGKTSNVTIKSGGVERWYLVTVPALYDCSRTSPVILSYHGAGQDASQQLELSQMSNEKFNSFAFAVYPQGIDKTWQGIPGSTANDLLFTSDILNQVEKDYNIDVQRVWATGKSDGAGFVNSLACDFAMSKRIAAFAPVSGAYYTKSETCDAEKVIMKCNAGRKKIPMIAFHGAKDDVVAYGGGASKGLCSPSIPQFIHNWAMRDNLGLHNVTTRPRKDTFVTKYGKKLEKGLITLVVDESIGNEWPSTTSNLDNSQAGRRPATFDATEIIMNFFKSHSLVTPVNIVLQAREEEARDVQPSVQPSSFPSPTKTTAATTAPVTTSTVAVSPTSAPAGTPSATYVPSSSGNQIVASTSLLAFIVAALAMLG